MGDLIQKLRDATSGSRELDAEIIFTLFAEPFGESEEHPGNPLSFADKRDGGDNLMGIPFYGRTESWVRKVRSHGRGPIKPETLIVHHAGTPILLKSHLVPSVSTSLDAIIGLIEEKLPEVRWSISRHGSAFLHNVGPYYEVVPASHKCPVIALCLALLSALAGES